MFVFVYAWRHRTVRHRPYRFQALWRSEYQTSLTFLVVVCTGTAIAHRITFTKPYSCSLHGLALCSCALLVLERAPMSGQGCCYVLQVLSAAGPPPLPPPALTSSTYFEGLGRTATPVFMLDDLTGGHKLQGPALLIDNIRYCCGVLCGLCSAKHALSDHCSRCRGR